MHYALTRLWILSPSLVRLGEEAELAPPEGPPLRSLSPAPKSSPLGQSPLSPTSRLPWTLIPSDIPLSRECFFTLCFVP